LSARCATSHDSSTFQHNTQPPKLMFLTAVAKPQPEFNFDGRVGIWEITKSRIYKRDTKEHKKGDIVQEPATLNQDRFAELMVKLVMPAIRKKMHWCSAINAQMDNAPPHNNAEEIFKTANETCSRFRIPVQVLRQPAQWPDFNASDAGVYKLMQTRIDKTHEKPLYGGRLRKVIVKVWAGLDAPSLTQLFVSKKTHLDAAIAHEGHNDHVLPHTTHPT
jgi:hypothetical protein